MKTIVRNLGVGVVTMLCAGVSANAAVIYSNTSDASPYLSTDVGFPPTVSLPVSGGSGVNAVGGDSLQTANTGTQLGNAEFVLKIPDFGSVANPFASATFSAAISSSSGASAFGFNPGGNNYNLYGLSARSDATVLASDFYAGSSGSAPASNTLIASNFPGIDYTYGIYAAGNVDSTNSSELLNYLNAQYANGAGAGKYVFLRISPNFNPSSFSDLSYYSGDSATNKPSLTYTTIPLPEPASLCGIVAIAGGAFDPSPAELMRNALARPSVLIGFKPNYVAGSMGFFLFS